MPSQLLLSSNSWAKAALEFIKSGLQRTRQTAFIHGISSCWSYLQRTTIPVPNIKDLLQPLENAIHQVFIPTLTGHPPNSQQVRDLLALPARLGGLGLANPSSTSGSIFQGPSLQLSKLRKHLQDLYVSESGKLYFSQTHTVDDQ